VRRAAVVVLLAVRIAHGDCPAHEGKTLVVARGSIVVDGALDDATWRSACFAEDFTQKMPVYGAPPTRPVKVAVAVDNKTLYIGARMYSASAADISDALTQRDDTTGAERFIVSIDPSHTRRIAYSFAVTARGVRADWIHTDDAEFERDNSWNPVWVAKSQLYADGWSTELAIPLSQLRLPRTPAASWGINFNWYVPHRQEDIFWVTVPRDRTAWASYFGELTELPPIRSGLGLELLPYVASRVVLNEDPSGPLEHRWLAGFEAGLDVKLRPLPGLTVAGTLNPDFGQVDADPAFVNLTAYEVRLTERRPFFVENNALFGNEGANYFYSRRIGALPRYLPDADAIDLPSQVRILGALAAGGYVAEQTQVAVLGAITDRTSADAIVAGTRQRLVLAPLAGWAATRVEHQLGASVIGGTATTVIRDLADPELAALLPSSAFSGGGDARLRTEDREYELSLVAGASAIFGSASALELVQRSSTHFFQRPDAGYLHFDPGARRLVGWHASAFGSKRAGMWQGSAGAAVESPRFDLNDIGVLTSADDIDLVAEAKRIVTTPTEHIFSWSAGGSAGLVWNFGGLIKPTTFNAQTEVTFANFNYLVVSSYVTTPGGSDDLTRGGPNMHTGWAGGGAVNASTPRGRAHQLSGALNIDVSPTLQQGVTGSLTLSTRITPALRLDVTPSLSITETHRQYVATVPGGGAETYGSRYLFGHLARKEAAIELRATWSLSPDLVLTLYAQPFASVGRYDQIGELMRAGDDDVRWYDTTFHVGDTRAIVDGAEMFTIAEPDYRVASLRSTAVLRWELAPGSTLFVVWQQARGGAPQLPTQQLTATLPEVLTQAALHTLAIKLSYWFG